MSRKKNMYTYASKQYRNFLCMNATQHCCATICHQHRPANNDITFILKISLTQKIF